jgi:FlaG/FlaF family flagellin (archaellin)
VEAQLVPEKPKNKGGRPKKSEKTEEIDEKTLKELQNSLSGVSRKAIKKLKALLDNENVRVQMQAALGIIRATVSALTRDTLTPGAGAEIHIHTSAQVAVVQPQPSGPPQPEQGQPAKATGRPITIVN